MKIILTKKEKKLAKLFIKENYEYIFNRMHGQEIDDYSKQLRVFLKFGILEKIQRNTIKVTEFGAMAQAKTIIVVTDLGKLIFEKL